MQRSISMNHYLVHCQTQIIHNFQNNKAIIQELVKEEEALNREISMHTEKYKQYLKLINQLENKL
jgi:hypothetical protein